jgi:hypothetical protein
MSSRVRTCASCDGTLFPESYNIIAMLNSFFCRLGTNDHAHQQLAVVHVVKLLNQ